MLSALCRGARGGQTLPAISGRDRPHLYAVHCHDGILGAAPVQRQGAGRAALSGLRHAHAGAQEPGEQRLCPPLPLA